MRQIGLDKACTIALAPTLHLLALAGPLTTQNVDAQLAIPLAAPALLLGGERIEEVELLAVEARLEGALDVAVFAGRVLEDVGVLAGGVLEKEPSFTRMCLEQCLAPARGCNPFFI